MTKLLSRIFRRHPSIEALSAYAEMDVESATESGIASHVAGCRECTRRVRELSAVRAHLRTTPSVEVPRSFRLRPADVDAPARAERPASSGTALRLMPALSALAVVLFAALIGADLLSNRGGGSSNSSATIQDSGAPAAQSNSFVPAPASPPSQAYKAETGADAAAPTAIDEGLSAPALLPDEGDAARGTAGPSAARANAPTDIPAPGTSGGAAPSTVQAEPTAAAGKDVGALRQPGRPDASGGGDGWSGLRIAEAITASIALAAGAIALVRWRREVTG